MAISARFFILCLLHLYIFCCAAKADEPVGYEHGNWGKEKAEWMDRCLAQYEKTDKKHAEKPTQKKEKEKKTEAAEEESYEVYPKNYEAAYDYEKLHVSDVILPLKIHRENYRKEQYAAGVGYGKENDEKRAEDAYEYERQETQEPYEEEYSSGEKSKPSAMGGRPYHYEPNREYPKTKKRQYHRRGFQQHPYRFAPFPHSPRGIAPPPSPFPQHLPPLVPPVPQPAGSVATTVLPPSQQPTVSSPSAVVPNVAPCRRKSLAKCSAFSQCVNGTANVQNCWATGPDMVFDGATQGCRSFAGVPECQKELYCKDRPSGWTFVGSDCTKIAFFCGMAHPDALHVCTFPDVVVNPIDKRSCVAQFAVEKCAQMLAPGSG